jgi:CheY-like chemotaxis protein
MISKIPICFYSMKKIIVDDERAFSESIILKLHAQNFTSFESPLKALNYLLTEYKPQLTKADIACVDDSVVVTATQQAINININKLKSMLQKKQDNDISVLLIDYHMPEMYGVEFLKKIAHIPIKKILVTAEKDYSIAVNAFNEGWVDAYIRKEEPNLIEKIQAKIFELEWKYFTDLSEIIIDIPNDIFRFLKKERVVENFKNYIINNHIIGFCMVDIFGSFLLKNSSGKYQYLIYRSKMQLIELAKIAKEDGASSATITSIEMGKSIPFFYDKEFWQIPAKNWNAYLYQASQVEGEPSLMWTVIDCNTDVEYSSLKNHSNTVENVY